MEDMGDIFNAMREAGKEKRRSNLASSTELLQKHGVQFESKNGGVHLIVKGAGHIVDFWPSTGKFNVRGGRAGRGVFKLLRIVKPKESQPCA